MKYLLLVLVFISVSRLRAERNDVVILTNGDCITGEVKSLENAKLRLKTDAMDDVYINWEKVFYIKAIESFRVEMQDGRFYFGVLQSDTTNHMLIVGIDTLNGAVEPDLVVGFVQIKRGFWQIVDISTELGFSYTKASEIGQLNFAGDISYRTFAYLRRLRFSSVLTMEKEQKTTQNHSYAFSVSRLLPKNWFIDWSTGAEKNTGLDLGLRLSLGMTGGNKILNTNLHDLSLAAGVQGTREWMISQAGLKDNLEGIVSVSYRRFRYTTPKQDVSANLSVYPNLTTKKRYRVNFETKIRWEIVQDFFFSTTIYENYDNQVEVENSSTNDYGLIFSLGWTK